MNTDSTSAAEPPKRDKEEPNHDHGFAPSFLPHGMQERWTGLTVAVVLHEGSTIVFVLNALRLLARHEPPPNR